MDFFTYKNGELYCEEVPAEKIARDVGTPAFVYSKATFLHHYRQIAAALAVLKPTICYSIKSCGNIHICRFLAEEGCGFDVTSGGELFRALKAGGDPGKIIYAGVGKTDGEIADAINAGIAAFNLESEAEIENIDQIARSLGKTAVGAMRINPDVDPKTHAKTATGKRQTKFGVDIDRAGRVFEQYRNLKNLRLAGIHIHIGGPINEPQPYVEAVGKITALIDDLSERGHRIEWFDMGGGFGVNYEGPDQARPGTEHARALIPLLKDKPYRLAIEPGRYLAGNAGILLTRVLYRKKNGDREFVIVDAAMNDLIRPSLYRAHHEIIPVRRNFLPPIVADVVGPVCETGDFLALERRMANVMPGDFLAVSTAGAYGFVQSSNYNSRPRAPEILVEGDRFRVVRQRESYRDLVRGESL